MADTPRRASKSSFPDALDRASEGGDARHGCAGAEEVEEWRRTGWMEVFHYGENRRCRLSYQLLADAGRYEDYPDFAQPALIFHGIHDDAVPVSSSREFSSGHPNATLEVLDSDHQLLNMLDYMAPKISRFLLDG